MPVPNTEGIEKKKFPHKPAGWYRMQFITYDERTAKDGKSQYARVELCHEDESDGNAWINLSYKPEALWKLSEFKAAIGMPDNETRMEDYQGTWLDVFLKVEVYEGEKKNTPSKFRALPDTVQGSSPKEKVENQAEKNPDDDLPF
jgi:hypothetical protein